MNSVVPASLRAVACLGTMLLSLAAPATVAAQSVTPPATASQADTPSPYRLAPGDTIAIKLFYNPELNEQMPIRPDGMISLPLLGEVTAAGRTTEELRAHLTERYGVVVKLPELSVIVQSFGTQKIYVGGEVGRPGEVAFIPGMTTLQAVILAGGDRRTASTRNVVIVRDQGTETPQLLLVDLKAVVAKTRAVADLRLQPRDIVFVPMSGIAKVNNFVTQYIKDVIPMSLVLGLYYNFDAFLQ